MMKRTHLKPAAFTLVEVLVAMAIFAAVLAALLMFTQSTLRFSSQNRQNSNILREVSEASDYMGSSIRRASQIYSELSINSKVCTLSGSDLPCFAIIVPDSTNNNGQIDRYLALVYRIEERTVLPSRLKNDDPWADEHTYIIREYRKILCETGDSNYPCGDERPNSISGAIPYFVLEGLSLDEDMKLTGTDLQVFVLEADGITLNFRLASKQRNEIIYAPSQGALELEVKQRN
ncbi:MAG: prepilin-type N-terminal cleavage/methylation domain-containing protein [Deinococcales bacterium]